MGEMIIVSEYNYEHMQKKMLCSLILVCVAVVVIAGCTSSQPAPVTSTPVPVTTVKTTRATTVPTAASTVAAVFSVSPTHFSGSADDVVSFTSTGSGLCILTTKYTGTHNFIIWLKDANGNQLDLPVNTIGAYSEKKSEQLSPGKYYLDVTATGPWTVDISTP